MSDLEVLQPPDAREGVENKSFENEVQIDGLVPRVGAFGVVGLGKAFKRSSDPQTSKAGVEGRSLTKTR